MHGFPNRTSESIVIRSRSESRAAGICAPLSHCIPVLRKGRGSAQWRGPVWRTHGRARRKHRHGIGGSKHFGVREDVWRMMDSKRYTDFDEVAAPPQRLLGG